MSARAVVLAVTAFVVVDLGGCVYFTHEFACDDDNACFDGQRCVAGLCRDENGARNDATSALSTPPTTTSDEDGEGMPPGNRHFVTGEGEGEGEGNAVGVEGGEGEGEGEGVNAGTGEGEGEGAAGGSTSCEAIVSDSFDGATVAPPFAVVDAGSYASAQVTGGRFVATMDGTGGPVVAVASAQLDVRDATVEATIAQAPSLQNVAVLLARIVDPAHDDSVIVVRATVSKLEIEVDDHGFQVSFVRTNFDPAHDHVARVHIDDANDVVTLATSPDGVTFTPALTAALSSSGPAPAYLASADLSFGGANSYLSSDTVALDAVSVFGPGCP